MDGLSYRGEGGGGISSFPPSAGDKRKRKSKKGLFWKVGVRRNVVPRA